MNLDTLVTPEDVHEYADAWRRAWREGGTWRGDSVPADEIADQLASVDQSEQQRLEIMAECSALDTPCPPWCELPRGHAYKSVREIEDGKIYSREHLLTQGGVRLMQSEWTTAGTRLVILDAVEAGLDIGTECAEVADLDAARKVAAAAAQLVALNPWAS